MDAIAALLWMVLFVLLAAYVAKYALYAIGSGLQTIFFLLCALGFLLLMYGMTKATEILART